LSVLVVRSSSIYAVCVRTLVVTSVLVLALALAGSGVAAAPVDAALAVSVNGDVQVRGANSEQGLAATPFMKLREGDQVSVAQGGEIEIIYMASGRRETWAGPVSLAIHGAGTKAGDAAPARVSELGAQVGEGLQAVPVLLGQAERTRAGQALIRGTAAEEAALSDEEREEVARAKTLYKQLKKGAGKADILPEMYLAGVLLEYGLASDAAALLKKAVRKCGGCEAPTRLLEFATSK